MRCPYCGFESADRTSYWNSRGKEIGSPTAALRRSDPRYCVSWSPRASNLDSGFASELQSLSVSLGAIMVTCAIHAVAGNGRVNGGDYFTLTTSGWPTFASATIYTVAIIYDPTGSSMTSASFTG